MFFGDVELHFLFVVIFIGATALSRGTGLAQRI
jgi:hypothetical protein